MIIFLDDHELVQFRFDRFFVVNSIQIRNKLNRTAKWQSVKLFFTFIQNWGTKTEKSKNYRIIKPRWSNKNFIK